MSGGARLSARGSKGSRAVAGFTLIELMVVIVILGALVALVAPNVFKFSRDGTRKTVQFQIQNLANATEQYFVEKRRLPVTLQELAEPDEAGEPWVARVPKDPWDQDYQYRVVNAQRREFVIESGGDDRAFGTSDDVVFHSRDGFRK
jgi:general secretion pathway protein G